MGVHLGREPDEPDVARFIERMLARCGVVCCNDVFGVRKEPTVPVACVDASDFL